MELNICHLYPDVLNLYGDRGNILCLQKRLKWRGMDSTVTELPIGEGADLTKFDLFFIGGGQDLEQTLLLDDLARGKGADICAAIADGKTFLCVCGGFQLLGHSYETADGQLCRLLGAVDFTTSGSQRRLIGNYVFRLTETSGGSTVVGFENHGGRTHLGAGVAPLGHVLVGYGNNGEDQTEGVRFHNVFGTYSHGPVLPKNPALADLLLHTALTRRYGTADLSPLDDRAELAAHNAMLVRLGVSPSPAATP